MARITACACAETRVRMHVFDQSSADAPSARNLRTEEVRADLLVCGGGLSGVCCAITAARQGVRVVLVQDRPVLGGNASSEVRLWVLGATSHMGNNNRWAREGGVIDELLVENMWRNPEGNAVLFDTILLEWVTREPNITLLLNTAIDAVRQDVDGAISGASAFCAQNQIRYQIEASLFCDASGDGVIAFLAGAAFRMGAEGREEFGEKMAPAQPQHTLLGHSMYFYSKDVGRPVTFVPPAFALKDIRSIPRFRELKVSDSGCRLWWLEYGGDCDTVYDTERIKWELWHVAYGVWDYIKNSGEFPEAETLTLEWMGTVPGKRESRRFEGDVMLTQQDVVEQRVHADAVGFGGWAIDLHPSDGVYSARPGCEQWHAKGVYQIPYRTMYSRNVPNLFLTGRLISSSHIAFGSTRVMATCAHNGQAVGMAAALCMEAGERPRDLAVPKRMHLLQQRLLRAGQWIPGVTSGDDGDLARSAKTSATSTLQLERLWPSGEWAELDRPLGMLLPLGAGKVPRMFLTIEVDVPVTLIAELWCSERPGNTTPDLLLASLDLPVSTECGELVLDFGASLSSDEHVFVILQPAHGVRVALSREQVTGLLMVSQTMNKAVAKSLVQQPPEDSGIESFAFWLPQRRPAARTLALRFDPPLECFAPANVCNGIGRPWRGTNAWIPARDDARPALRLEWAEPQSIRTIELTFDTDFDHPMESVLMGHPERVMPACVTAFSLCADEGRELAHVQENHQTRYVLRLDEAVKTATLELALLAWGEAMPAVFEVRCYA